MSKGAEQTTHDAVRMYAMGALALTEAKSPSKGSGKGEEDGSDDEAGEEGDTFEGEDNNATVVNQAAAAVSQALVERNNELTKQLTELTSTNSNLQSQLSEAEERISNIQLRYEQSNERYESEKSARAEEVQKATADKAVLSSQVASLERELNVLQERVSTKSETKEHSEVNMAKIRAELTSLQRKNEELANDKMELEVTLEDLVLDKEGLCQEKELLVCYISFNFALCDCCTGSQVISLFTLFLDLRRISLKNAKLILRALSWNLRMRRPNWRRMWWIQGRLRAGPTRAVMVRTA